MSSTEPLPCPAVHTGKREDRAAAPQGDLRQTHTLCSQSPLHTRASTPPPESPFQTNPQEAVLEISDRRRVHFGTPFCPIDPGHHRRHSALLRRWSRCQCPGGRGRQAPGRASCLHFAFRISAAISTQNASWALRRGLCRSGGPFGENGCSDARGARRCALCPRPWQGPPPM